MMGTPSPDWSLLPHDPIGFFGLPEGYARRDLKTSYHALIRIYKPEKAPQEFQKIRAAYEMLDGQLRYGRQDDSSRQNTFDWSAVTAAAATTWADEASPAVAAHQTLSNRLDSVSAKQLYSELNAQREKSPRDYYALAVLSDVAEKGQKQMFLRWLLTGLQAFPHDPGLFSLLRELFHTEPASELCGNTLIAVSKIVNDDRFYYLTEPIWDRLATAIPFSQLRKTLAACERNLRDPRVQGKVAFYIHLAKSVMWQAPIEWLQEVFRFLNEHHTNIEHGLEYDLEFMEAVFRYRQSSGVARSRSGVRDMIHRAICQYCELDELKGDRAVITCQTRLANDTDGVLSAFSFGEEKDDPLLAAWGFVSEDVAARHSDSHPSTQQDVTKLVYQCLIDCQRSDSSAHWTLVAYGPYLLIPLAAGLVFLLGLLIIGQEYFGIAAIFAAAVALGCYPISKKVQQRWILAEIKRQYRRNWRERVARFAAATQFPHRLVVAILIDAAAAHGDEFYVGRWVAQLAASDQGLAAYCMARQFLR